MSASRRWQRAAKCGKFGLIPAICGAAMTAFGVVALACTSVMGPLSITPTAGMAGSSISTTASGLKVYPARYAVHFTTGSNGDCMAFSGVVTMKTITTNAQGAWSNVSMTIPSSATMGSHGVCGMEVYPVKGGTGTGHGTFTVV